MTMQDGIDKRRWALAEGYIPDGSHGPEELQSHETACILNANDADAAVEVWVYFADRDPAGPYRVAVPARRMVHVRFDQLDDPESIPRATEYASTIESDLAVVVKQTRLDARQAESALMTTIAHDGSD
jgi:hypothetical protein